MTWIECAVIKPRRKVGAHGGTWTGHEGRSVASFFTRGSALSGDGLDARGSVTRLTVIASGEVRRADAIGMSGRPLHQLDPVTVRVGEPRGLRAVGAGRVPKRFRLQASFGQHLQGGGQR